LILNYLYSSRLVFKNGDNFSRNAYSDYKANEFDVFIQSLCQDIVVEVKTSLKIAIECTIHPNMLFRVDVK